LVQFVSVIGGFTEKRSLSFTTAHATTTTDCVVRDILDVPNRASRRFVVMAKSAALLCVKEQSRNIIRFLLRWEITTRNGSEEFLDNAPIPHLRGGL